MNISSFAYVKPGSHSHDFTGDHWRLDSRGVVAGWSAARLSIVAGVVVRGILWSPGLSWLYLVASEFWNDQNFQATIVFCNRRSVVAWL